MPFSQKENIRRGDDLFYLLFQFPRFSALTGYSVSSMKMLLEPDPVEGGDYKNLASTSSAIVRWYSVSSVKMLLEPDPVEGGDYKNLASTSSVIVRWYSVSSVKMLSEPDPVEGGDYKNLASTSSAIYKKNERCYRCDVCTLLQ